VPPRPLPYREVKRKLVAAGFTEISQKGSHVKFAKLGGQRRPVIVPKHDEVRAESLRSILFQASLTWDEFEAL
jgi:predicted RNA binding protein YcfA (HicA-like mRNA interferase family)